MTTDLTLPAAPLNAGLAELEATIDVRLPLIRQLYYEVGAALREIHDRDLWRENSAYVGWADYLLRRFSVHPSYASRLMAASTLYAKLPEGYRPANEAQARELMRADEALRIPAMQVAVEVAANGRLSAELVARAVQAASDVAAEALLTAGYVSVDGNSVAIQGAVTEEILEAIKRRTQDIANVMDRKRKQIMSFEGPLGDLLGAAQARLDRDADKYDLKSRAYLTVQLDKDVTVDEGSVRTPKKRHETHFVVRE